MTATAIKTRRAPARKSAAKGARRTRRATKVQTRMGYAFGGLAFVLTALSLSHLAEGVAKVAHRAGWEGWSIAVAIDLGFIALEVMPFCVGAETRASVAKVSHLMTGCVLCASAAFNAVAFTAEAQPGAMTWAAAAIGIAVPGFVAGFTYVASSLLIGKRG